MTTTQTAYATYLRSPRWRILRTLRRWLDGGRCRVCNSRVQLETHHRSYQHRGGSLIGEFGDIVTLCKVCHKKHHVDD